VLERLVIQDFAVARSVTLRPGPGLNVFTGETGAGKSLVVDALAFAFGGRRGREVVASGAERAQVEATLASPAGSTTVERTIGLSGRSTARINGEPVGVEQLQALVGARVDLHGQSEQLSILRPAVQLAVLDEFAGLGGRRDEVAAGARELRRVRREARALASDVRERERLIDQLTYEVSEINGAALEPGEDAALRDEQIRLSSTERRREDVEAALLALEAAPLGDAVRAIEDLVARDASATNLADLAALAETSATDLGRSLRRYRDSIDDDPGRLAAVLERLDTIARLRRKYGESVEDILRYLAEAEARLESLTDAGQSLESLEARGRALSAQVAGQASDLSRERRGAAGALVQGIGFELERLGMSGAELSVGFACQDDPDGLAVAFPDYEVVITERAPVEDDELRPREFTESGIDRIEFLASFNPGETPRPLAAVSSGGETSRFLLALTTVLGQAGESRLVVLDEVDEGVGGRAGAMVGEALARLATRHQVLCVTHLPQVAAYAERHFVVSKQSDGGRTWSEVSEVEGETRVAELASMLGGVSAANRAVAEELLRAAKGGVAIRG
jgi:DNA repair protein RecN (Recombination protein N)